MYKVFINYSLKNQLADVNLAVVFKIIIKRQKKTVCLIIVKEYIRSQSKLTKLVLLVVSVYEVNDSQLYDKI